MSYFAFCLKLLKILLPGHSTFTYTTATIFLQPPALSYIDIYFIYRKIAVYATFLRFQNANVVLIHGTCAKNSSQFAYDILQAFYYFLQNMKSLWYRIVYSNFKNIFLLKHPFRNFYRTFRFIMMKIYTTYAKRNNSIIFYDFHRFGGCIFALLMRMTVSCLWCHCAQRINKMKCSCRLWYGATVQRHF